MYTYTRIFCMYLAVFARKGARARDHRRTGNFERGLPPLREHRRDRYDRTETVRVRANSIGRSRSLPPTVHRLEDGSPFQPSYVSSETQSPRWPRASTRFQRANEHARRFDNASLKRGRTVSVRMFVKFEILENGNRSRGDWTPKPESPVENRRGGNRSSTSLENR